VSIRKIELLRDVLKARETVAELDQQLKDAKEEREKVENQLIELMELSEEKTFKTDEGIVVMRKEQIFASFVADRKDAGMKWVDEECGRNDLIKPSVHPRALTTLVKTRIEEGEPVPSEIINIFPKQSISIRKGG